MYSLDSCTLRLLYNRDPNVVNRVLSTPHQSIYLSTIVLHEAIGGRLANIDKALGSKTNRAPDIVGEAYRYFFETLDFLGRFQHLLYTVQDEQNYRQLTARIKRVGPQDCRIGVQAKRAGFIVVTQNVADFQAAGFVCEDWSLDEDNK